MNLYKLKDMVNGWFIGNFEPSVLQTHEYEVAVMHKKKGPEDKHVHKIATEYNVLVSGSMSLNGVELIPGDIFIINPNEWAAPVFHEDSVVVCVKTPSISNDKYK